MPGSPISTGFKRQPANLGERLEISQSDATIDGRGGHLI